MPRQLLHTWPLHERCLRVRVCVRAGCWRIQPLTLLHFYLTSFYLAVICRHAWPARPQSAVCGLLCRPGMTMCLRYIILLGNKKAYSAHRHEQGQDGLWQPAQPSRLSGSSVWPSGCCFPNAKLASACGAGTQESRERRQPLSHSRGKVGTVCRPLGAVRSDVLVTSARRHKAHSADPGRALTPHFPHRPSSLSVSTERVLLAPKSTARPTDLRLSSLVPKV